MDWKIELIAIPVTDVDRAKDFYTSIGFNADHDHRVDENVRFVQLTPPGSGCSICIGEGVTDAAPGSVVGMQIVVADAEDAYKQLTAAGVAATPVEELAWGKFTYFADPDGNKWAIQELPNYG
ncbi:MULTISPECIES: glyoxalase superfamily protein [Nocardia]|uniref:Lactoylglutathione lyase (Methylglyoxalase) (Aldoketomutase) (Glyoxalase I) (Glx I) (Ketone-aldehyde mutase) (S-D-lactoylglutathione methylglyoxal lyase) n=2 Tax=Nocardia TaxID=1817 RepID=K0F058_NOCB7|nr:MULTISPECIES: glyoxalase superfamily protein [Nocardia]AFU05608.1 Lactoylglutathione lyase (Methylglyoxalase) (Aldoketomutase) (Glyoxalase I) (Glx I) (Ketone-aldehyde mutase) (S-D-lactoylglutathione methylglyoxal lyase) [Nocardia brasiliensis ATCC 700358]KIA62658.1 glyoxalase [Nocardia vulneris]OCF86135.1 glyoxalase [Nocardia brasiliensis]